MIILAPSGAGKSTFAATHPEVLDLDQDPVIASIYRAAKRRGEAAGTQDWWKVPVIRWVVSVAIADRILAIREAGDQRPILTAESQAAEQAGERIMMVLPSKAEYERRAVGPRPGHSRAWTLKDIAGWWEHFDAKPYYRVQNFEQLGLLQKVFSNKTQ